MRFTPQGSTVVNWNQLPAQMVLLPSRPARGKLYVSEPASIVKEIQISLCIYAVKAVWPCTYAYLGLSIMGLVTDRNTKLCCGGFIIALFQSTTANKIDSEHTQDYKRVIPKVWEAEILQVIVNRIGVFSSFMLISDDFRLKAHKIAIKHT